MRDQRLGCAICDDIIGVYEPIAVRDGSGLRHTSVLNEPALSAEHRSSLTFAGLTAASVALSE